MSSPQPNRALDVTHDEPPASLATHRARKRRKGAQRPITPIYVDDVVKLLAACTPQVPGKLGELAALQLAAIIGTLYRTGVRVSELLDFEERDLMRSDMGLVVRNGKGGKRRVVLMDEWGWQLLDPWLEARRQLPPGKIFCVMRCANAGGPLTPHDVRRRLKELGRRAGVTKRVAPHQFRHGFSIEARREGIDYLSLQRQLGHANLMVTEQYFAGLDFMEVLEPFARRQPPMIVAPRGA